MSADTEQKYMKNAQGHLVPIDQIKAIDLARDALVKELVNHAQVVRSALTHFKGRAFADIGAFVQLSAEQYGAKVGGKKGNVQLQSFDGRYKVLLAVQDNISFDERLIAAKELIDECLRDWTERAGVAELQVVVNETFRVDRAGNIRTSAVLALRRYDIKDGRWLRAMDAISDALQVTGTSSYIRVYERIGSSEQWAPISLDLAAV